MKRIVSMTVNGRRREDAVADHLLLIDYLRELAGLTGTKRGCDGGEGHGEDGGEEPTHAGIIPRTRGRYFRTYVRSYVTDQVFPSSVET